MQTHPIQFSSITCIGKRQQNQDMLAVPAHYTPHSPAQRSYSIQLTQNKQFAQKGTLALVCDGVAGCADGAKASEVLAITVSERYYEDPSSDILTSLQRVVEAANRELFKLGKRGQLASTLVAAVYRNDEIFIANVGDSRAYLIRDRKAHQITIDHNQRLHPTQPSNRLTRCIGAFADTKVDTFKEQLLPGDRILLCSDGLSNFVQQSYLARLASTPKLEQAASELVRFALQNGSSDNISVVLLEVPAQ